MQRRSRDLQERRLPGSVGSDDNPAFAGAHRPVDAVEQPGTLAQHRNLGKMHDRVVGHGLRHSVTLTERQRYAVAALRMTERIWRSATDSVARSACAWSPLMMSASSCAARCTVWEFVSIQCES